MAGTTKAVFLSYASQDAEAVRGIAQALQAGGIEAWFDQAELRGGDAWDQKIRRQIRDCALFMPVISAATQARGEGYFRREWKLAVERTHDMADGVPFLFPIVLDGVPDRDALVPEVFRQVQWTRVGPAGLPPAFVTNVHALLEGGMPASSGDGSLPSRSAGRGPAANPRWPHWATVAVTLAGVGMGVFFAINGTLQRRNRPKPVPAPAAAAPAKTEAQAAKIEPAPAAPAADPRRVALARFENLTGDASLDGVARLIESEMTRGLGTLSNIRLLPVEVSGRAAARAAARAAGAGSVIVGSYLKQGDQLEISAEVVLVAEGEVYGTAGPAMAPIANPRGPALAELIDRLTTGASNVTGTLQTPPTRISAVTYNRPWPRWSVVQRLRGIRLVDNSLEEQNRAVQQSRDALAEAPEMLKIKHDLARLLMNIGRYDEAEKLFRELLGPDRGRLAEVEILAITYDEALLAGDPGRALTAARAQLEIRPLSDTINYVLACLWAQNRPRAAFMELERWWKKNGAQMPEQGRLTYEMFLITTESVMHLLEDQPEKALAVQARMETVAQGRPTPWIFWHRCSALVALGREADLQKLVTEVSFQAGADRVEPIMIEWSSYLLTLHYGRKEEAARWLAAALKTWDGMPAASRADPRNSTYAVWLNQAVGRNTEALAAIDAVGALVSDPIYTVGPRAVVLTAMGRTEEAAPLMKRLEQWDLRNARGLPQYWRARAAAIAGDKVKAVELLRQAVANGLWFGSVNSPTFYYGRSEAEFAALRGYEPFDQLLKPKG